MLSGKKILLIITGSIAAYKTPILVRQLLKKGAEVKVIMTPSAMDFVSKLTLSTLTKSPVLVDLFDEQTWANHVMLGRWADIMLIAPLSCNTLSKMANGQCDNLVMATYLSATCSVVAAPAMDEDMWHHPSTRSNLERVRAHGCLLMDVSYGELASGLVGEGRMAEPEEIVGWLERYFNDPQPLKGKKVLITAGPTYEPLDPVRFIGNYSSGKMGYALAEELAEKGAAVQLVSGPVTIKTEVPGISVTHVHTAAEMLEACKLFQEFDVAVMAAAVADYTPVTVASEKIKKTGDDISLPLKRTTDILAFLGKEKKKGQLVIGFALETVNEKEYARKKLEDKGADLIVMNSLRDEGAGFGVDTNKATLFYKDGREVPLELQTKKALAKTIVASIIELLP